MVFIQGCLYPPAYNQAHTYLELAARDAADGDFEDALGYNEKALKQSNGWIGDLALYQRGLFYAHPKNPDQNYKKAIEAFTRLRKQYPRSRLYAEAEVWIITLEALVNKNQAVSVLMKKDADQSQSMDLLKNQLDAQKKRIDAQLEQIRNLETQLEKMKNVDIGIENKKRKVGAQ
jgi:tetratricopeptide (TPR) repeat protein